MGLIGDFSNEQRPLPSLSSRTLELLVTWLKPQREVVVEASATHVMGSLSRIPSYSRTQNIGETWIMTDVFA
jgi:hypothetical protein